MPTTTPARREPWLSPVLYVRVWGREAMFCPPQVRGEPYSGPPTPSACARIVSCMGLAGKPCNEIEIDSITMISPIRRHTRKWRSLVDPFRSGKLCSASERTLRSCTVLVNPEFVIGFRLAVNPRFFPHPRDPNRRPEDMYQIVRDTMRRGVEPRPPFLGWKEMVADWEFVEDPTSIPAWDHTEDLGSMLGDMVPLDMSKDPPKAKPGEPPWWRRRWESAYVRLRMERGVIRVPPSFYEPNRERKMLFRAIVNGVSPEIEEA